MPRSLPPRLTRRRRARSTRSRSIARRAFWVFAFGKAAAPMAAAAVASLLQVAALDRRWRDRQPRRRSRPPYPTMLSMRGDHPIPGRHSFAAAAKIAEVTSGRRGNDVAIVLMSGGASSLIGAPLRGMSEADFTALCRAAARLRPRHRRDERRAETLLTLGRRPSRARARSSGNALPRDIGRRRTTI